MEPIFTGTGDEKIIASFNTTPESERSFEKLAIIEESTARVQKLVYEIKTLQKASDLADRYVQLLEDYSYCPALIGTDGKPVFLFDFIEAIDGLLDYGKMKNEFPSLSFAQLNGAISFLRKIAQLNCKDVDPDGWESELISQDSILVSALKKSFEDQEICRVLNSGQYYCRATTERP